MRERPLGAEDGAHDAGSALTGHLLLASLMTGPFLLGGTAAWSFPAMAALLAFPVAFSFSLPESAPARILAGLFACMGLIAAAQLCFPRAMGAPAHVVFTLNAHATAEALQFIAFSAAVFCAVQHVPAHRMAWWLFTTGALLAAIGLVQRGFGNTHYYGIVPIRVGDPFGPYTNPNQAAVHLELSLFAGVGCIWPWWRARGGAARTDVGERAAQAVLLSVGIALIVAALYATGSRAALLCAPAAAVLTLPALATRSAWRAGGSAVLLLGTFVAAAYLATGGFAVRDMSVNFRLDIYPLCVGLIRDFPLLGAGAGSFMRAFEPFVPVSITWGAVDHAHSDWLQLAAEYGVPFTALTAGALGWRLVGEWRGLVHERRSDARVVRWGLLAGCSSALLHASVDFPFRNPAVALLAVSTLGVLPGSVGAAARLHSAWPRPALVAALVLLSSLPVFDALTGHQVLTTIAQAHAAR